MVWLPALASVIVVSLISFTGLLTLSLSVPHLKRLMFVLISFAAGALLGDAFIHILPELAQATGFELSTAVWLLVAFIIFYVLENGIHWHHYHHVSEEEHHPMGILNLVGDGVHNFIDGAIIAGSYLVDVRLGFATTLAVIFHEIPQEIGDFVILMHSGFTRVRALIFNLLSGLTAVAGAVLVLWLGQNAQGVIPMLLTLTAGGFIYIATVDLIPELHKEVTLNKSVLQLVFLVVGMGLMLMLKILE